MALPTAYARRRAIVEPPPSPPPPWSPQWSFVGVSEMAIAASGNLTFGLPSGIQAGDLLVLAITVRSGEFNYLGTAWQWQSNAAGLGNTTEDTSASRAGVQAFACVYDAENPPETTLERVGGSLAIAAVVAYRANGSIAIAPPYWASEQKLVGDTNPVAAIDPTESDRCLLVAFLLGARNGTSSNMAASVEPQGASGGTSLSSEVQEDAFTERFDAGTPTSPGASLAIFDAIKTEAGAIGTLSATHSTAARHTLGAGVFRVAEA